MRKDDLIPEQRLDKNGVLVTRHVKPSGAARKNGLLARLIPSLAAAGDRAQLIKKISSEVGHVLDKQEKALYLGRLSKYPADTLSIIDDALDAGEPPIDVINAIAFYKDGGVRLREGMVYREAMQGRYAGLNVLDHVRESLDVDDLTVFPKGSDEYQEAAAVLNVAATASAHRIASQTGHRNIDDYEELLERERETTSRFRQMTPELASLIVQHRSRTDDILTFMETRGVAPADVDIEHLTAYLENPSPAISGGVL